MLSNSALATNQPHKLPRLPVREQPRFASGAVLDDDATTLTRSYLKRARRKRYGHSIPPKQGSILAARSNVGATQPIRRAADPPPLLTSSGETFTMIRVAAAMQPSDHAYSLADQFADYIEHWSATDHQRVDALVSGRLGHS
jgi:hypothetical protein